MAAVSLPKRTNIVYVCTYAGMPSVKSQYRCILYFYQFYIYILLHNIVNRFSKLLPSQRTSGCWKIVVVVSTDNKIKALNNQCGGRDIKYHQHGYFNIMTRQNRILIIPTVGVRIGNSFKENCSAFYRNDRIR